MLELRQRSRSSGAPAGYQPVDTDDEMDLPILDQYKIKPPSSPQSTICKSFYFASSTAHKTSSLDINFLLVFLSLLTGIKICALFSLSGVLFLFSISHVLRNRVYIIKEDPDFTSGIYGAIYMYVGCFIISSFLWYRSSQNTEYSDDDLRLLD